MVADGFAAAIVQRGKNAHSRCIGMIAIFSGSAPFGYLQRLVSE